MRAVQVGMTSSRPPVIPPGRRSMINSTRIASTASVTPSRRWRWIGPTPSPFSSRPITSWMVETVSVPITAPDRLLIPPTTSIAIKKNVMWK